MYQEVGPLTMFQNVDPQTLLKEDFRWILSYYSRERIHRWYFRWVLSYFSRDRDPLTIHQKVDY
jgi:hypothetical protein